MTNLRMRRVVSFCLPKRKQMERLIDAVCPPEGESNYLEWSVNEETGELELYEEAKNSELTLPECSILLLRVLLV